MIKRLLLTALALTLLACAAGCAAKEVASSAKFTDIYAEIKSKTALPDMISLSDKNLLDLYGIKSENYSEMIYYVSEDGLAADEIAIFKAKDEKAAETLRTDLENRLKSRINELSGYLPEQADIVKKAGVIKKGLFLELIVGKHRDDIIKIVDSYIK